MHNAAPATTVTSDLRATLLLFTQVFVGDAATARATPQSPVLVGLVLQALPALATLLTVIRRIAAQHDALDPLSSIAIYKHATTLDGSPTAFLLREHFIFNFLGRYFFGECLLRVNNRVRLFTIVFLHTV